MDKAGAAANGRGNVDRFGHLIEVGTFLEALLRVGVDAIGTLHGVRHSQRDQALFTRGEGPFGEDRAIPRFKLLPNLGAVLAHLSKARQVLIVVVVRHSWPSRSLPQFTSPEVGKWSWLLFSVSAQCGNAAQPEPNRADWALLKDC